MSVKDSLFLSQTVFFCHRQLLSVTENLCLSEKVCFCDRQGVSVIGSPCLSQTFFFCHRQSFFVRDSLYLSQKIFLCPSVPLSNNPPNRYWPNFLLTYTRFLTIFFRELNPIRTNFVNTPVSGWGKIQTVYVELPGHFIPQDYLS